MQMLPVNSCTLQFPNEFNFEYSSALIVSVLGQFSIRAGVVPNQSNHSANANLI